MSKKVIYWAIAIPCVVIAFLLQRNPKTSPVPIIIVAGIGLISVSLASSESNKERRQRRIQEEKRQQEEIQRFNELKRQEQIKLKQAREIEEMESKRQEQAKIEQARTSEPWYCVNCGGLNAGKNNFCQMCGNRK